MTDKEIIIDGVNVSECSYYSSETYPYTCEVWDNECEAQNCYYKQLKRLEQENKELKAENERLKKELESLDRLQKLDHSYVIRYRNLLSKYVGKYKQTLQEIKKIAERQLLVTKVRTYRMVFYADFSEYRNEILQKITKAEEE